MGPQNVSALANRVGKCENMRSNNKCVVKPKTFVVDTELLPFVTLCTIIQIPSQIQTSSYKRKKEHKSQRELHISEIIPGYA